MPEQTSSEEDLDELVHDACGEIAASINNAGEDAQRKFLREGLPVVDPVDTDRLLLAIAHLEKSYDQVAHTYRKLSGADKQPTRVSQDAAQLLAEQSNRLLAEQLKTPNPFKGAVTVRLTNKLQRLINDLTDTAESYLRLQENGEQNVPLDPVIEDFNRLSREYMPDGPTPPHVHAMTHEQRMRYENGGLFSRDSSGFVGPMLKGDYSTLEVRILAKAIKEMGLGEWYHELMEMVCFPDIDDVVHILNTLKEHLNDDRVKFLHVGEDKAPESGS